VEGRPLEEENDLVEQAKRGDARAYEELVRTYQGIAFRTAYLLAGSADEARDAAQEGFVKAYRALGAALRFGPGSCKSSPTKPETAAALLAGARL
jgi:DNA-directed RNA polymerase specialized sigma24 family protein